MARYTRGSTSRLVAILATGVVTAGPLLAAGPAVAAPPRIEFSQDGLGLLSCNSTPSDRELTVRAESTVIFVNDLREDATLRIDGRDATRVPDDGSAEVLFHRGTVRVELVPDCGLSLSRDFDSVSVTVVSSGNTSSPSSGTPSRSRVPSSAATSSSPDSPDSRESDQREAERPDASTSPRESASSSAAPAGETASPADPGSAEGTAAGDDQGVAAETVSADATSAEDGANGLLAIVAVVCVVGVSAGAIRAIVAQRASRTRVA